MAKKHDLSNLTDMRRKDRGITDDKWIKTFFQKAPYINIATVMEDQPFITMTTFVYDEETHAFYLHTSRSGRLQANIGQAQKVCVSYGNIGRLLPSEYAREFSTEYESVVAFGTGEILSDMETAKKKMQLMIDKYFPHLTVGKDYHPITDKEIKEIATYKISIDSWSGKKKEVELDFPGAISFDDSVK